MRLKLHQVVLPCAALLAILPMLFAGPSCGHDFDFHLLSWLEAANQFARGGYPHWAYTPAWNAGEPRFLFYPPISWTLGALLGLLLPWKFVAIAFTWVALTLSGFTAFRFARACAGAGASLVAAVVYLANPYMLFTAYERSAYGELLAAAWMPLLFAALVARRVRVVPLAVAIALLWLTNAPAAVMGCYAVAALAAFRLILPLKDSIPRRPLALATLAGTILGLALPAFYLLPAAHERPSIQSEMAVIEGMRIVDNTLFHHMRPVTDDTVFHDVVLHTASLLATGLLIAIALLAASLARQKRLSGTLIPLLLLAAVIAVLLTPISVGLWAHIPQLAFLQFPWRLCALLAPIFALLLARVLPVLRPRHAVGPALIAAAILIAPAWAGFHQRCFPEDSVPARVALFHSPAGTDATDEYTPTGADNDSLHPHEPAWSSTCQTNGPAVTAPAGPIPDHLTLTLPCPSLVVLNRRRYPAWQIFINHVLTLPQEPERDDGLITLAVPAGTSTIDLRFARTPDRTFGLVLSLLAALVALIFRRRLA